MILQVVGAGCYPSFVFGAPADLAMDAFGFALALIALSGLQVNDDRKSNNLRSLTNFCDDLLNEHS